MRVPGPAGGVSGDGPCLWIPRATYRLQLNRDFTLRHATALLSYLDELGVSHCYLRPTYPDWPYSIFTMVHGQTPADCQATIDAISAATGEGCRELTAEVARFLAAQRAARSTAAGSATAHSAEEGPA